MTEPLLLRVPEISCAHCEQTIQAAIGAVAGVERVEVDIDAKHVSIVGGDRASIVEAIEGVGFDVER